MQYIFVLYDFLSENFVRYSCIQFKKGMDFRDRQQKNKVPKINDLLPYAIFWREISALMVDTTFKTLHYLRLCHYIDWEKWQMSVR